MSSILPARWYIEDDAFEAERLAVFGREWMILGRTDELVHSGGYVAEEIAGYPVFIVLDGALGSLMSQCADIDFGAMQFTGHRTEPMRCKWKLGSRTTSTATTPPEPTTCWRPTSTWRLRACRSSTIARRRRKRAPPTVE